MITGDAASATAALGQVDAALDANAASAKRAAAANDDLGRSAVQGAQKAVVSAGQQRAAYQNLGRQAQDVAVQLQMGTNIGSIVAMQGGQVADAVAGMGGRLSGLASFLAGPFGAAVIVGAGVLLNQLIPAIFGTSEAMDEGESSSFRFSSALDVSRLSALDAADGMRQLEADIRKTIAAQGDFQRQNAAALVQSAAIRRARLQESEAELAAVMAGQAKPGSFGRTLETALPSFFGPSIADVRREATLRRQIAADTAALPGAQRAAGLAQMLVTQREVNESLDAGAAATGRYQRELARLNESRQRNIDDPLAVGGINDQTYRSELRRITQQRDTATRATASPARSSSASSPGRSPGRCRVT